MLAYYMAPSTRMKYQAAQQGVNKAPCIVTVLSRVLAGCTHDNKGQNVRRCETVSLDGFTVTSTERYFAGVSCSRICCYTERFLAHCPHVPVA
jgi:hypothetical protein